MLIHSGSEDNYELSPETFLSIEGLEEATESEAEGIDNSAGIKNPNRGDQRRLFQAYEPDFTLNPSTPYERLPNRLEENGPTPLTFSDHFYETMGGVSIIY